MSSNGAGVVCLHALHVHTVYTWEQSHRNKKPPLGAHAHRNPGTSGALPSASTATLDNASGP